MYTYVVFSVLQRGVNAWAGGRRAAGCSSRELTATPTLKRQFFATRTFRCMILGSKSFYVIPTLLCCQEITMNRNNIDVATQHVKTKLLTHSSAKPATFRVSQLYTKIRQCLVARLLVTPQNQNTRARARNYRERELSFLSQ